ncbi:MAG: ArsA family ATPase [Acidimicrobiia bacterium]
MELSELCSESRVIIVAGKGGVGKTTVSAALAVAAARAGRRALVVELEGKSGLPAIFGPPVGAEVYPNVSVLALAPEEALVEYLEAHGLGRVSKRLANSGALDIVATAVPGMKDILVLGKVKALQRAGGADVIVVDGPATGHAVTFLLSSRGVLDAVRVGPVLTQATDVSEMLADPERTRVVLVTVPEETPVNETTEAVERLTAAGGITLGPVVVNGVYPERNVPGGGDPEATSAALEAAGVTVEGAEADQLARAAWFLARRRELQRRQLDRLASAVGGATVELPFLFGADLGTAEIEVLADALTEGMRALAPAP